MLNLNTYEYLILVSKAETHTERKTTSSINGAGQIGCLHVE